MSAYILGAGAFVLHDAASWSPFHYVVFLGLVFAAFEVLAALVSALGPRIVGSTIQNGPGARPLEKLAVADIAFITVVRALPFLFDWQ